jgi:hypothetical protein
MQNLAHQCPSQESNGGRPQKSDLLCCIQFFKQIAYIYSVVDTHRENVMSHIISVNIFCNRQRAESSYYTDATKDPNATIIRKDSVTSDVFPIVCCRGAA